jgi:hypothetical protein
MLSMAHLIKSLQQIGEFGRMICHFYQIKKLEMFFKKIS